MEYVYNESYTVTPRWNRVISPAFITTLFLTYIISFILSPLAAERFFSGKRHPTISEKRSCFRHVLPSTTHSVFVIAIGAYLLSTGGLGNNSRPDANVLLLQVTIAFYLVDFTAHILDKKLRETTQTPMHHIGACLGLLISILYTPAMGLGCFRIMTHITMLFANTFYTFAKFKRRDCVLFTVASVGMVLTSLLTRVAPIYWLWKRTAAVAFFHIGLVPLPPIVAIVSISIVFDIFNVWIVYKMTRGCIKHFLG